jgi:hypothetical protein
LRRLAGHIGKHRFEIANEGGEFAEGLGGRIPFAVADLVLSLVDLDLAG